jgi:hypothetical protein
VKWPLKRERALLEAPVPLIQSPTTTAFCTSPRLCRHVATRTERFPGGKPHYAHEVCKTCGRHVRWFPKPATIERRKLNAFKLARLLMAEGLSDWERQFVKSLQRQAQKKFSPKQQAMLDRLVTEIPQDKERRSENAAFGASATTPPQNQTQNQQRKKNEMKVSEIYSTRWIKVEQLPPEGKELTIARVGMEEIGREKEEKPVCAFAEIESRLVLNPTNLRKIAELTGKDDTDDWPGVKIRLVRVEVPFGPDMVAAIRVEACGKAPLQTPQKLVRRTLPKPAPLIRRDDDEKEALPF